MNLPEALVTGRAVLAVRGVLIACSIVPGRPDCVLGLTNPVIGRPDCVMGLEFEKENWDQASHTLLKKLSMVKFQGITQSLSGRQYLTAGVGPPPWLVPGSLSDVPGPGRKSSLINQANLSTLRHWEKFKLTCNLSNRALIQHHLSNPLLVHLNLIYVYHLCKSTGFQAPRSLWNTQCFSHMDSGLDVKVNMLQ